MGETINVKDGYAMNYLIPNGLALRANESNARAFTELKKQKERKMRMEIENSEKLASEINGKEITISMKTHEENKIYGSVSSQVISEKLAEIGFNIDKKHISLTDHIKETGDYDIDINLGHNIKSSIKVHVIPEE
jgi:large subunit ribosomal protein L9